MLFRYTHIIKRGYKTSRQASNVTIPGPPVFKILVITTSFIEIQLMEFIKRCSGAAEHNS